MPAEPTARSGWWPARALWLGLVAFATGGVGQWLLMDEASRPLGTALLVAAMIVGVVAWSGTRDLPLMTKRQGAPARRESRQEVWLRLGGIGAAVALWAASIAAYLSDPQAIFGTQGWLWLLSMALLVVSCARWSPATTATEGARPRVSRTEVVGLGALLILSLITHLAFLGSIPWRTHFDEGFAYLETMHFYGVPQISLFQTTWEGTSLPSLWFGLEALLMRLTGPGLAGTRLGVALLGALTVLPVYGIARVSWGRTAAVVAGFSVAVSAAYVHYSRVSILNITTPFAWAVCFYFLLKGLRSRQPADFAFAGLAAGLSMYTYYATRLLPVLLVGFFLYLLVFHFRGTRERLAQFGLLVAGFLIGFGPLLGYFILNPEMWPSRSLTRLNIPPAIPSTWEGWVQDWNIIAPLAGRNFLGLSVLPTGDTVYFLPFLLAAEAMLVILGLGVLIWRWRQPASFLVLAWGLGVILTGGTLLDAEKIPVFNAWAPAFPTIYFAMALPVALLVEAVFRYTRGVTWRRVALWALMLGMLLQLGANAYTYLAVFPGRVPAEESTEAIRARTVESFGPGTRVRVMGKTEIWSPLVPVLEGVLAHPGTTSSRFFNPGREMPVVIGNENKLAFILYGDVPDYLPAAAHYYPGGTVSEHRLPDGTLMARSYVIPTEQARRLYGVQVSTEGAAKPEQVERVGDLPPGQHTYPLTATWSGSVYIGGVAPVHLAVQGGSGVKLWAMGQPVEANAPLSFARGWVPFAMQATVGEGDQVTLTMQEGDEQAAEVEQSRLWPAPIDRGLAASFGGAPPPRQQHRIDSLLGAGFIQPNPGLPDPDPDGASLVPDGSLNAPSRWEGELYTGPGSYSLLVNTEALVQVSVDGALLINRCAAPDAKQKTYATKIPQRVGWHRIRIDFYPNDAGNALTLSWTRPNGVTEVVPHDVFRLGQTVTPGTAIKWPDLPPTNPVVPCVP